MILVSFWFFPPQGRTARAGPFGHQAHAAAVCGFIIFIFSDADFRKSNIFYHNKKQKSIVF